ncbi:hypothetical protein SPAR65_1941 [Streptococcus pneumoniae GA40563]|nr:hypothetical protein SPAR65_1941 [Streptococcus pneumoniae GA40563]
MLLPLPFNTSKIKQIAMHSDLNQKEMIGHIFHDEDIF